MKALDVARLVLETKTCHVFRKREDGVEYDAKPYFTGSRRGWTMLDLFSASVIVRVHAALSSENKAKLEALDLVKMARVSMRVSK